MAKGRKRKDSAGENVEAYRHETETRKNAVPVGLSWDIRNGGDLSAINRALTSCKQSGNIPANHFAGTGKMVDIGSGSSREVTDYNLLRFACYLTPKTAIPASPKSPMLKSKIADITEI